MPDRPLREAVALAMGWRCESMGDPWDVWYPPPGHRDHRFTRDEPQDYPAADYSGVPAMEAWCRGRRLKIVHGDSESEVVVWLRDIDNSGAVIGEAVGAHYAEALARAIVAAAGDER